MSDQQIAIKEFIIGEIKRISRNQGLTLDAVDPAENLVEAGVIDSFGFLELLTSVEQKFEVQINYMELDPSEFSSLDGLTGQVLKEIKPQAQG